MSGSPGGGVIAGLGGNPSLANIIAKRAPRIPQEAPPNHTIQQRLELARHREKLLRAQDETSFAAAAVECDNFLDAISEGVGKIHAISQEEYDAESAWLHEMLETRGKGFPPGFPPPTMAEWASPMTPIAGPPKKKARTSMTPGTPGIPGEKKDIVTWTKFHHIMSDAMGIEEEQAISAEKEHLKACAKTTKTWVTAVVRAREIIRILNREIPSVRIDAEKVTSDLVTTRTVKSDHLKFWYLKPNFKDKEVDLLLRVARHRTGTYWEVSYGVQQLPAQQGGALHLQGIGSITAAAALTAAAPELQGALADANAQALALLASPNQHNPFEAEHVHAGHVVKAVVVSEAIDIGMPDSMGLGLGGLQGVEGHLDHAQHVSMGMHGLGAEHADDGALHAHALHAHAHIAPALEAAHLQHLAEQMVAHEMGMHLQAPLSLAASHEYPSLLAHEAPHPSLLGGDPNELHAYRLHAYRHDVSLSVAHEQHHDGSQDLPMAQSAPLYLDAVPMTQEAPMMHYAGSAHDHDVTHLTMHSGEVQIELA